MSERTCPIDEVISRMIQSAGAMSLCVMSCASRSSGSIGNASTWPGHDLPGPSYPATHRRMSSAGMEVCQPAANQHLINPGFPVQSPTAMHQETNYSPNQWGAGYGPSPYNSVQQHSTIGVYPGPQVRYIPVSSAPCPGPPQRLAISLPELCQANQSLSYNTTTTSATAVSPNSGIAMSPSSMVSPCSSGVDGRFLPTVPVSSMVTRTSNVVQKEKKAVRPYKLPIGVARSRKSVTTSGSQSNSSSSSTSTTSGGLSPLDSFRVRSWPLREWLYKNRKYPYPKKAEKRRLAQLVGWTVDQVSMWFANTRRRIKKVGMDIWSGGEFQDLNLKDTKATGKATAVATPCFYPTTSITMPLEHPVSAIDHAPSHAMRMHALT